MAHKFLIKDIASQAGVSVATVDRVLNDRLPVRADTKRRVHQAISELERQESQIGLTGRKFMIDMVVEAPPRFCKVAEMAMTRQAPYLHPAIFRVRYTTAHNIPGKDLAAIVEQIVKRGSNGVVLTARNTMATKSAIETLWANNIPVVTLATDVTASKRIAYTGMENRSAGETAAFLIGKIFQESAAAVLVTTRNLRFHSEEERELGFRTALQNCSPNVKIVDLEEGPERPETLDNRVSDILRCNPDITAVYSIGGNNRSILRTVEEEKRNLRVFIAHDLDGDNQDLINTGAIDFVLHHDMEQDMRNACQAIMRFHRFTPGGIQSTSNQIQILTRKNLT